MSGAVATNQNAATELDSGGLTDGTQTNETDLDGIDDGNLRDDSGTVVDVNESLTVPVGDEADAGNLLVDVVACADADVTVVNKSVSASVIEVADVNLNEGGFVVVEDQTGAVIGHSGYVDPDAENQTVPIDIDADIGALAGVTVTPYQDADGDEVFNVSTDDPYCVDDDQNGADDGQDDNDHDNGADDGQDDQDNGADNGQDDQDNGADDGQDGDTCPE